MTEEKIPEIVLEELEIVRASGATNMLDRGYVLELLDSDVAFDWLSDNKPRYMEALTAMGKLRTQ